MAPYRPGSLADLVVRPEGEHNATAKACEHNTETAAVEQLAARLCRKRCLQEDEYRLLIEGHTPKVTRALAEQAYADCQNVYGDAIYVRGLIEFTNYCAQDCYYCGIRASNRALDRFRLTPDEVLICAQEGYAAGMRTFVLQGGEDPYWNDEQLTALIARLKDAFPDCAITLSVGERSEESYRRLKEAGADRYLLRHETASPEHYTKLHPRSQTLENRLACLQTLREAGFAVGAGFMVGSPFQDAGDLAKDLKFIETFQPEMCGIGPFIPHRDTPFATHPSGSVELTCFMLSLIRIICPNILLPATTALETLDEQGREKAILSGANVIMPNISPFAAQESYRLYNNKPTTKSSIRDRWQALEARFAPLGKTLAVDRGDPKPNSRSNLSQDFLQPVTTNCDSPQPTKVRS